ncbi:MAG: hypothetical protein LBM06_01215 [Prevotellaceae bacterium]|jgi:outer membrane lipoprotein-sorting protein|nr:hypothetical protein [Prevotellaceae bacterium]
MKKILGVYLLVLGCLAPTVAGQTLTARQTIDRAAGKLRQAGGVEATFTLSATAPDGQTGTSTGTLRMQGNRFVLDAADMHTWFDGHTQWTYVPDNNEVNLSTPNDEELQSINPYALLYLYQEGYDIRFGANRYELVLKATDKKRELRTITLRLDARTWLPTHLSTRTRNDEQAEIEITSCRTAQHYPDSLFRFDAKQYPTAEIIDLR